MGSLVVLRNRLTLGVFRVQNFYYINRVRLFLELVFETFLDFVDLSVDFAHPGTVTTTQVCQEVFLFRFKIVKHRVP